MKFPYERIIQWSAGPISTVSGYLATLLVTKVHFLGNLHLDKANTGAEIAKGLTFAVATGVTYAAHHKWLDNLAKWWGTSPEVIVKPESSLKGDGPKP